MNLTFRRMPLRLADSFRTAKADRTDKETLWVRVEHEGIEGWGEAAPVDTYRQTLESAEATLRKIGPLLGDDPTDIEGISNRLTASFHDQLAAVCAVDAALHDWLGKRAGLPTVRVLGLSPRIVPLTSFSLGIGEPEQIADKMRRAAEYPIIKVKLGSARDEETLAIIRDIAPEKTVRVDANAAWTVDETLEKLPMLAKYRVEFVEQPIRAGDRYGLRRLHESGILPIVADESCVVPADVLPLAGCVAGVNIKLSKCGGIRPALKMIHLARAAGLKVMLGCMIESSLGIAAAAQLAPLADWLDLDGHLLISNDPFNGLGGREGLLTIGGGPGLGVMPVA
ncbi:MAG: dipeptide epimerase [Planctomycetes bacterium]|nr:dipeptide epimerase [Planctomycetota bacterium]